jgi:hypothetical protein
MDQGDLALALESLRRGIESARDLRLPRHAILALLPLAAATRLAGDAAGGRTLLEQALVVAQDARNRSLVGAAWVNLGYHDWVVGDLRAVVAAVVQGLMHLSETPVVDEMNPGLAGEGMALAGVLALERGDVRHGARLLGAAERFGFRPATRYPDERERYAALVKTARERLGDEAYAMTSAEGHAMTREQAIAYALEQGGA